MSGCSFRGRLEKFLEVRALLRLGMATRSPQITAPAPRRYHERPLMESVTIRHGPRRVIDLCRKTVRRRAFHQSAQCSASVVETQGDIQAAVPIRFNNDRNQFSRQRPRAQFLDESGDLPTHRRRGGNDGDARQDRLLRRVRIVPASPSYFTATPRYTDDVLHLSSLLRKYQTLPTLPAGEAPRVAWKTRDDYKTELQEPVRAKGYNTLLELLKRLNYIHPSLIPADVTEALEKFKRLVQPHLNQPKPIVVNELGWAKAVGRRKSSKAQVSLVEGEGQCLVNGRTLTEYFGRMHDRESAVWALKATQRLDKYNVWARVAGGGTTGQAEAITLGLAKALLAHEPDLKPALRRGEFELMLPRCSQMLTFA